MAATPDVCFTIKASTTMPDFEGYPMMMSPGWFSDTPSLDAYMTANNDANATYVSEFQQQLGCPGWNGSFQRYHLSYFSGLLTIYSVQPLGPCPAPPNARFVCRETCLAAAAAFAQIVGNASLCPGPDPGGARAATLQRYDSVCAVMPSKQTAPQCLTVVAAEKAQCGFPLAGDFAAYCGASGAGTLSGDKCCYGGEAPTLAGSTSSGTIQIGSANVSVTIFVSVLVSTLCLIAIIGGLVIYFCCTSRRGDSGNFRFKEASDDGDSDDGPFFSSSGAFAGNRTARRASLAPTLPSIEYRHPDEMRADSNPYSNHGNDSDYVPYQPPPSVSETYATAPYNPLPNREHTSYLPPKTSFSPRSPGPKSPKSPKNSRSKGSSPATLQPEMQISSPRNLDIVLPAFEFEEDHHGLLSSGSAMDASTTSISFGGFGDKRRRERSGSAPGNKVNFRDNPRDEGYGTGGRKRSASAGTNGFADEKNHANDNGPSEGLFKMRVLYDYSKNLDDELDLVHGQIVTVQVLYDDAWGYGILETGQAGAFPLAVMAALDDDSSKNKARLSVAARRSSRSFVKAL